MSTYDPNPDAWARVATTVEAACVELDAWLPALAWDIRASIEHKQEKARETLLLAADTLAGLADTGYTSGRPSERGGGDPGNAVDSADAAAAALKAHMDSEREPLEGDE